MYEGNEGRTFRPSLFLTVTLDTYGAVHAHYNSGPTCACGDRHPSDDPLLGVPTDMASYDYVRAARDAIHFGKLVDRLVQNIRRVAGFEVQYFAAVEPQRRLAPHLHLAMRGTLARAEIRQIVAATYHQVWWPHTDIPAYVDRLPVWDEATETYVDPDNGEVLPTWDEALDAIGDDPDATPAYVARFGPQVDIQGVLAGTPDADRCIGYLAKYLTKQSAECHQAETVEQVEHMDRLMAALRFEPCVPTCPNWLKFGIQPKNAKSGMRPGGCKGKAHSPAHLGYAGRRVLVSRKWSGKTLADHRHERRAWVLANLGLTSDNPEAYRYTWLPVPAGDPLLAATVSVAVAG
ncbi:MAG: replication initiator [Nocardioidaceae bacterium]